MSKTSRTISIVGAVGYQLQLSDGGRPDEKGNGVVNRNQSDVSLRLREEVWRQSYFIKSDRSGRSDRQNLRVQEPTNTTSYKDSTWRDLQSLTRLLYSTYIYLRGMWLFLNNMLMTNQCLIS